MFPYDMNCLSHAPGLVQLKSCVCVHPSLVHCSPCIFTLLQEELHDTAVSMHTAQHILTLFSFLYVSPSFMSVSDCMCEWQVLMYIHQHVGQASHKTSNLFTTLRHPHFPQPIDCSRILVLLAWTSACQSQAGSCEANL